MVKINENYEKIAPGYLFPEISRRTKEFLEKTPSAKVMRLGIGNTTEPLPKIITDAIVKRAQELSTKEGYSGYADDSEVYAINGIREKLQEKYKSRGIDLEIKEIFISDGAKSDSANIQSIFSSDAIVAVQDPAYPVYVDTNVISGRTGPANNGLYEKIVYMKCTAENDFFPEVPSQKVDLIYLCSPNNPTGAVATKEQLKKFVDYAISNKAVIIFDAAYAAFIKDENLPKSIYEVEGAKKCAIEINSFSKSAGFTGVRLGWTVVPKELVVEETENGKIHALWMRRQTTFFNGASNIVQIGGLAALSEQGLAENQKIIDYYMENAKIIKEGLESLGITCFGGNNAPYVWLKVPKDMTSWEFFDKLLNETHVVGTPGSGFGPSGEGYFRLSAFGHRENIEEAVKSIKENLKL